MIENSYLTSTSCSKPRAMSELWESETSMVVANFISPITLCLGTRVCSLSLSEVTNGCGSFQRDHILIGN